MGYVTGDDSRQRSGPGEPCLVPLEMSALPGWLRRIGRLRLPSRSRLRSAGLSVAVALRNLATAGTKLRQQR